MSLTPGSRLGPYEILAPIGAGGMGEVYRARDTRLERTVAVKVLPPHLSVSAEARQRFEREAKTISRLSHPHICALHDVGSQDGIEYLVMEYLEGDTLSDRVARGPLPLEQTLRCGQEIADALDKAHRHGIVHRDLKPGNVMLTASGVKLLDFGLAKAFERPLDAAGREQAAAGQHPMAGDALTSLPTVAGRAGLTQEGTILGTYQYMAPEQLEGKDADARTDIWALGCTLYEMATGRSAFAASSRASLITAIMSSDPAPISSLQPMSPPSLDRLARTCLAKDPEDRWQSAADIRRELRWIAEGSSGASAAVAAPRPRRRDRLAWTAFALAAAAAVGMGLLQVRRKPETPVHVFRSSILPPEKTQYAFDGSPMALSPDGRRVAFAAGPPNSPVQLWIRSFESSESRPLPGTEGGFGPFWSPDGRFLAFFGDQKLKKIDVSGGTPQTLCDAPTGSGGTWGRAGVILFATYDGPILRVSDSGGAPVPVTRLDENKSDLGHGWPRFLPDGRRFFYQRFLGEEGNEQPWGLCVRSLESKEEKLLLRVRSNAAYVPPAAGSSIGYLLYLRNRILQARPFDERRLEFADEAVPVVEEVRLFGASDTAVFAVSDNGVLAYQPSAAGEVSELVWFDRKGTRLEHLGEPAPYGHPRLSHDGRRLALVIEDPQTVRADLWVYDLVRRAKTRITFGPGVNVYPVWSPDDTRIAFASNRSGAHGLYQTSASGTGGDELLLSAPSTFQFPTDWSQDGHIAFMSNDSKSKTGMDIGIASVSDRKAWLLLNTPFNEGSPEFSPDGRYLAHVSDESGKAEVYVRTFPAAGGKWQVSTGGGRSPLWRRDGKEIFFMKVPENTLMAADVRAGPGLEVGTPRVLFQTRIKWSDAGVEYAVSPDGSRFLINSLVDEGRVEAFTVVQNWPALLGSPRR
jgi:serine/threonine protein kinase